MEGGVVLGIVIGVGVAIALITTLILSAVGIISIGFTGSG